MKKSKKEPSRYHNEKITKPMREMANGEELIYPEKSYDSIQMARFRLQHEDPKKRFKVEKQVVVRRKDKE